MFQLKIERGGQKGKTFELREGTKTQIGRSRKSDLQFSLPDVSGLQVRIEVKDGQAIAENLSRFGTLLDGKPLEEATPLKDGQRLALGTNTVLLVEEVPDLGAADDDEFLMLSQAGVDMRQFVHSEDGQSPEDPFAEPEEQNELPTKDR